MCVVVSCVSFVLHWLLFVVRVSVACCVMFVVRWLFFVVCCLMRVDVLMLSVWRLVFTASCFGVCRFGVLSALCVVCCVVLFVGAVGIDVSRSLFVVGCWCFMCVVCCLLLFVKRCVLLFV